MEEEKQLAGEDRLSGEIVEVYQTAAARGGGGAVQPPPAGTACRARAAPPAAQDRAVDFPGLSGGGAGCGGGLLDLVSAAGRQQRRSL